MNLYINFNFKNLKVNDTKVQGFFDAPDNKASCNFIYDLRTKEFEIWNCSLPEEKLLPLPFSWLEMKLEENGYLKSCESRTCY